MLIFTTLYGLARASVFSCQTVADSDYLVDSVTGLLNTTLVASTWCPAKTGDLPPADYVLCHGLQFA